MVSLWEVRVKIVFPVKSRLVWNAAIERKAGPDAEGNGMGVEGRKGPRLSRTDRTNGAIGIGAIIDVRTAAKHLALRLELDVDLEADDDFPVRRYVAHRAAC